MAEKKSTWTTKVLGYLGERLLDIIYMFAGGAVGGMFMVGLAIGNGNVSYKACTSSVQVFNHETGERCPTENPQ